MDDKYIVELYWKRNETAISETSIKYGSYLNSISFNILVNSEDAQECVNDTYHDAWNSMPPHCPSILSTFLGKITRRISIDRWRKKQADKRGGGEITFALEELKDCVAGTVDFWSLCLTQNAEFLCAVIGIWIQFLLYQSNLVSLKAKLRLCCIAQEANLERSL